MATVIAASEAQKRFGYWSTQALRAPVTIQRHGHDTLCLISAEEYRRLKRLERLALRAEEISEDEARLIAAAEFGE